MATDSDTVTLWKRIRVRMFVPLNPSPNERKTGLVYAYPSQDSYWEIRHAFKQIKFKPILIGYVVGKVSNDENF
jgi:hypothetical protein